MLSYRVSDDIRLVCELLGYGVRELASDCGVSYPTLNRWLKDSSKAQPALLEEFYGFAFARGIRLNKIKEQLYAEDSGARAKLLFHGVKSELDGPFDLVHSKSHNDFGPGLYCGETLEQAALFVAQHASSSIYALSLDLEGLRLASFGVDTDWMLAIAHYRGRLSAFPSLPKVMDLVKRVETADVIAAPIADNRIFELVDSFAFGETTDVQCAHCLSATHLGFQYMLKSQKALEAVKPLERCYLSRPERAAYIGLAAEHARVARDKTRVARRSYRGQGLYVDELLGSGDEGV